MSKLAAAGSNCLAQAITHRQYSQFLSVLRKLPSPAHVSNRSVLSAGRAWEVRGGAAPRDSGMQSARACRSRVTGSPFDGSPMLSDTGACMARDQLQLMESAIILAEELHFSRAARRLKISQPALTKQIAELERRIGAQLSTAKTTLSASQMRGRAFIKHAQLCVFYGKRAMQSVRTAARENESVLSIGRSPHIGPFLVSTLLTVRLPLFPDLKLDLPSRFSLDLVHDVLAGTLDLAIVTAPPESPSLSTVQIAEAPFFHHACGGCAGPSATFDAR